MITITKKDMGICTLAEDVGQLQKNIRELDQDLGRAIERIDELERLIKEPKADRVSKDTIHVKCPYCRGHGKIAMCSPG